MGLLLFLVVNYLQGAFFLFFIFSAFNAFFRTGISIDAIMMTKTERKIILTVPAAQLLIRIIFPGFFGSILSVVAFVAIYAHFTGNLKNFKDINKRRRF